MRSVVPTIQWHVIHNLHVSTMFLAPKRYWPAHEMFPPDNYKQWSEGCQAQEDLRGLHSLRLEIIVWDTHDQKDAAAVEDDSLVSILEPLNRVTAPLFEVEMNLAIPKTVQKRLGTLAFMVVVKQRPYNTIVFPI